MPQGSYGQVGFWCHKNTTCSLKNKRINRYTDRSIYSYTGNPQKTKSPAGLAGLG